MSRNRAGPDRAVLLGPCATTTWSVHRQPWPEEVAHCDGDPQLLAVTAQALGAVRKAKTDVQVSMRAEVATLLVTAPEDTGTLLRQAEGDLRAAGRIGAIEYARGDEPAYAITLS